MADFAPGPYGFGTPLLTAPHVAPTLGASRQIGSGVETRGQYTHDANGNVIYDTDVRQLVLLALGTVTGSCAVKDLGRAAEPGKISDDFGSQKRTQVTNALAYLVNDGLISIDLIEPTTLGSRSFTLVKLTDLSNGAQFSLSI